MTEALSWHERAEALADDLVADGKLSSTAWRKALVEVPRHHFVPRFYLRRPGMPGWDPVDADDPGTFDQWWMRMYANTSLVTQIGPVPDGGRDRTGPVSSSSAPGLMTRMLEMLDISDRMRVLEIGTGTGYNAALLTHRLGDKNVFSIDIDPCLVASASRRLADLGYRPTLAVADGASGLAEYAPYDGIIVTCAVRRVPWALVEQTADNGWLLLDVKIHAAEGNLVLLHRQDGRLVGRFDNGAATFMQMRTTEFTANHVSSPERDRENVAHRVTDLNLARPWEHRILWFLLHLKTCPGGWSSATQRIPTLAASVRCSSTALTDHGARSAPPTTAPTMSGRPDLGTCGTRSRTSTTYGQQPGGRAGNGLG
ncbi:MAG TPA: methyltransferase domain-containing protein [Pseudonocardia sp.]